MRISDWSSDVCSSVLDDARAVARQLERERAPDAAPRSRNKGNLARQSAHVLLHSKLIWSVDPDDGFAIDRRDALVGHRAHREPRAAAARILENLGDLTGRGHGRIERGDRGEADGPAEEPLLWHPMGDELREKRTQ